MVMRRQHVINIVEDAFNLIIRESMRSGPAGPETGGSLLGVHDKNVSTVLYAVPPGPKAKRSVVSLRTDEAYQNACYDSVCRHYQDPKQEIRYLSDWHKHPGSMSVLSDQDHRQSRKILIDPDRVYLKGLAIILIAFNGNRPVPFGYWVTLSRTGVNVSNAKIEIIPPDHKSVKSILRKHPYVNFDDICSVIDGDGTPLTPPLKEPCVVEEFQMLRTMLHNEILLGRTESGLHCIYAQVRQEMFCAVLPPEYPLNPPICLLQKNGAIREYVPNITWNSCSRIIDIVEEILQEGELHENDSRNLKSPTGWHQGEIVHEHGSVRFVCQQ